MMHPRAQTLAFLLALSGCSAPSAPLGGSPESDKAGAVPDLDSAAAAVGGLYWTGTVWQGKAHDPERPVYAATLIGPDRIATIDEYPPKMIFYETHCRPDRNDHPGALEFRVGDADPAKVTEYDIVHRGMIALLDQAVEAPFVPVPCGDRERGEARFALYNYGGWSEKLPRVHFGAASSELAFEARGHARDLSTISPTLELEGEWTGCDGGAGPPGAAVVVETERGTIFLAGALGPPCEGSGARGGELTFACEADRFRPLLRRDPERVCRSEYSSDEEERCLERVSFALEVLSPEDVVHILDACEDAFWLQDDQQILCIERATQSRHPMGRVIEVCKQEHTFDDDRHDCIGRGAETRVADYERCHEEHRLASEDDEFLACLLD